MAEPENALLEILVTLSCGNVFADLGFLNPEEELLKADLVRANQQHRLTQARTAEILGVSQPTVSNLVHGQYEKSSIACCGS
jgi:predicted XRE-type DNA-binding protein